MDPWERELHSSRIIAGSVNISIDTEMFVLLPPSRDVRYQASEVYRRVREECYLQGVLSDDEVADLMVAKHIYTAEDERQRNLLIEKLDDMKVGLFENFFKSNNRILIRRAIDKGRAELGRLEGLKHSLDYVSCGGVAAAARMRYLVGYSLVTPGGRHHWEGEDAWERPDTAVDEAMEHLIGLRLTEGEMRELSRTDPWRSLWNARQHAGRGLFDLPAADLSDDQRYLMMWATIYDNVRDHPACPDDGIIEDDDMLDGWMIKQKKTRESQRAKKHGDETISERVKKADEIFVVAQTVADARRIESMNDDVASIIKGQRLAHLKSRGEVPEMEMPDTWARLQGEVAKMEAAAIAATRTGGKT